MLSLKRIDKKSLLEFEDHLFLVVETDAHLQLEQLYYVDAIIVNSSEEALLWHVIKAVRKHYSPEIYLMPVYCVPHKGLNSKVIKSFDDAVSLHQLEEVTKSTRAIKSKIDQIFQVQRFPDPETELLHKTLQYLFTRSSALTPIPDGKSSIHYQYPMLSTLVGDQGNGVELKILRKGTTEGLITAQIKDKVHLCYSCSSAHVNIRESCRSCGSIDLVAEDMIHHFQCAYVGRQSDFEQPDSDILTCPKCHRVCRHIGIDYDKPSQIYHCNNCGDQFQDANFTYRCMDCDDEHSIQHLQEFKINTYFLASKGERIVINGLSRGNAAEKSTLEDLKITGIYNYNVFAHFVRQEEARAQKLDIKSVLARIVLPGVLVNKLSHANVVQLQLELSKELKSYVGDADMVSSKSPHEYFLLLTDTTIEKAQKLKNTIQYNVKELLRGNFKELGELSIEVHLEVLGVRDPRMPNDKMN